MFCNHFTSFTCTNDTFRKLVIFGVFSSLNFFFLLIKLLSKGLNFFQSKSKRDSGGGERRRGSEQKVQLYFTLAQKSAGVGEGHFPMRTDGDVRMRSYIHAEDSSAHSVGLLSVMADLQVSRSAFYPRSATNYFSTRLSGPTHTCFTRFRRLLFHLHLFYKNCIFSEEHSVCIKRLFSLLREFWSITY